MGGTRPAPSPVDVLDGDRNREPFRPGFGPVGLRPGARPASGRVLIAARRLVCRAGRFGPGSREGAVHTPCDLASGAAPFRGAGVMGNLLGWTRLGAFLGGNALALAALYMLLFSPVRDFLADQQSRIEQIAPRLDQAKSTLARNQAVAALAPAELSAGTQRFIQGDSLSLLNADLLTRLRQ